MASDSGLWADYTVRSERKNEAEYAPQREVKNTLDKDAFLLLLITQLKYQDPMNPVEDKEFIAQMAQFSALEQMQNINKSMVQQQGYSLIGKTVAGVSYNSLTGEYTDFSGRVDSVSIKSGEVYVNILVSEDTYAEYKVSEISEVYEDYYAQGLSKSTAENIFNSQNIALVGKYIQAITFDENLNPTGFVEGIVDYVKFTSGTPILVVGNKEVYPQEVISVAGDYLLIGKPIGINVSNGDGTGYTVYKGPVEGISIVDGKAYVQVGAKSAEIEKIDALIEAIKYLGKEIKSLSVNGVVDEILVKDGVPYFVVDGEEVKWSDIVK